MNSRDYWRKREAEHIKAMKAREASYDVDIEQIYGRSIDSIQQQIEAFYNRYATQEGITLSEARKRISKTDVQRFSAKAKQYVEEKNFTPEACEELRLYNATMKINRLELLKSSIALELVAMGNETQKYVGDTLTGEAAEEAKRQAGILGMTLDSLDTKRINEIVTGSYRDSATFSQRIWGNNESLKRNLDTLLTQAIIAGKHSSVLAKDLQKQFNASQYEARRLMRTESSRVQSQVANDSYKDRGIEEYEWLAEPGACEICSTLNGKRFKVNGAEYGNDEHPLPPEHPNCRCATIPVVDEEETDDWIDFLSKGGTQEEWEALNKKDRRKFFI